MNSSTLNLKQQIRNDLHGFDLQQMPIEQKQQFIKTLHIGSGHDCISIAHAFAQIQADVQQTVIDLDVSTSSLIVLKNANGMRYYITVADIEALVPAIHAE